MWLDKLTRKERRALDSFNELAGDDLHLLQPRRPRTVMRASNNAQDP